MTSLPYMVRYMVLKSIRLYQKTLSPDHGWFSAVTMHHCLYRPTCSEYAYIAVERFGVIRGVMMGSWRILRCNPLSQGGHDPVPEQ